MANTISITIKMLNQVGPESRNVLNSINSIRTAVDSLQTAMNSQTSLKNASTNINNFIKSIGTLSGVSTTQGRTIINNFHKIATSMHKLGSEQAMSPQAAATLEKITVALQNMTIAMGQTKEGSERFISLIRAIDSTIKHITSSSENTTSLKNLSEVLSKLNLIASTDSMSTEKGLPAAIDLMATKTDQIGTLANHITRICRQLSSAKVGTTLNSLTNFMNSKGFGAPMSEYGFPDPSKFSTMEKIGFRGHQDIQKYSSGVSSPSAYDSVLEKIQAGEDVPISKLSSMGTKFGAPDFGSYAAMFKGRFVHGALEDAIRSMNEAQQSSGKMLKEDFFEKQEWIDQVKAITKRAEDSFKTLLTELSGAAALPKDTNIASEIDKYVGRMKQDINFMLRGDKTSVLLKIKEHVLERARTEGAQVQELFKKLAISSEKDVRLQVVKPGGEISKDLPENIRADVSRLLQATFEKLARAEGITEQKIKLIGEAIKKKGLTLKGMADIYLSFGKSIGGTVIDLKPDSYAGGDKRLAASLQTGFYAASFQARQEEPGWGVKAKTYIPSAGMLSGGLEAIDKDENIRIASQMTKSYENIDQVIKNLDLRKKVTKEVEKEVKAQEQISKTSTETARASEVSANKATEESKIRNEVNNNLKNVSESSKRSSAVPVAAGGGGENVPPGGGVPPSMFTDTGKGMYVSRGYITDAAVGTSRYLEVLTEATLKQQMFSEQVDISNLKIKQHESVMSDLASVMSRYISLNKESKSSVIIAIAHTEKLTEAAKRAHNESLKQTQYEEKRIKTVQNMYTKLSETISKYSEKKKEDLGILSMQQIAQGPETAYASLLKISETPAIDEKTAGRVKTLSDEFVELTQKMKQASTSAKDFSNAFTSAMRGDKGADPELKKRIDAIAAEYDKVVGPVTVKDESGIEQQVSAFGKLRNSVKDTSSAVEAFTTASRVLHAENVKNNAVAGNAAEYVARLGEAFKSTGVNTKNYKLKTSELILATDMLREHEKLLSERISTTSKAYRLQTQHVADLSQTTGASEAQKASAIKRQQAISAETEIYSAKLRKVREQLKELSLIQSQQAGKTSEYFRGMARSSLKGFGNMLRSQMAWIMGYSVMFGVLGSIKTALSSVITLEYELARAIRTTRIEHERAASSAEKYVAVMLFTDELVDITLKFGSAVEDVSEAMYLLGSAGLTQSEVFSSLDEVFKLLIATEGELNATVKMVAGIYNNYSDQLEGAIAATSKFKYINDIVVATFRDHQVELNELREGYKHLIPMAKESNLTFLETTAILGFLNDRLIKSGIAGRSVQSILSRISKDTYGFAKAFDISIDPDKPLDFLDIIGKISKRFKKDGQTMAKTADQIGLIFKRLGLRGAKAFATLVTGYDELEKDVEELGQLMYGASDEMAKIMQERPDVAFSRAKAGFAALIRDSFSPIIEGLTSISLSLVRVFNAFGEFNRMFGGIGTSLVKYISSILTLITVIVGTQKLLYRFVLPQLGVHAADQVVVVNFLGKAWSKLKTIFLITMDVVMQLQVRMVALFLNIKKGGVYAALSGLKLNSLTYSLKALAKQVFVTKGNFYAFMAVLATFAAISIYKFLYKDLEDYLNKAAELRGVIDKHLEEVKVLLDKRNAIHGVSKELEGLAKAQKVLIQSNLNEEVGSLAAAYSKLFKTLKDLNEAEIMTVRRGGDMFSGDMNAITQTKSSRIQDIIAGTDIGSAKEQFKFVTTYLDEINKKAEATRSGLKNAELALKLLKEQFGVTNKEALDQIPEGVSKAVRLMEFEIKELKKSEEVIKRERQFALDAFFELRGYDVREVDKKSLLVEAHEGEFEKYLKLREDIKKKGPVVELKRQAEKLHKKMKEIAETNEKDVDFLLNQFGAFKRGEIEEPSARGYKEFNKVAEKYFDTLDKLDDKTIEHLRSIYDMYLDYTNKMKDLDLQIIGLLTENVDFGSMGGVFTQTAKLNSFIIDTDKNITDLRRNLEDMLLKDQKKLKAYLEIVGFSISNDVEYSDEALKKMIDKFLDQMEKRYNDYSNLLKDSINFDRVAATEQISKDRSKTLAEIKDEYSDILFNMIEYKTIEEKLLQFDEERERLIRNYNYEIDKEIAKRKEIEHTLKGINTAIGRNMTSGVGNLEQLREQKDVIKGQLDHVNNVINLMRIVLSLMKLETSELKKQLEAREELQAIREAEDMKSRISNTLSDLQHESFTVSLGGISFGESEQMIETINNISLKIREADEAVRSFQRDIFDMSQQKLDATGKLISIGGMKDGEKAVNNLRSAYNRLILSMKNSLEIEKNIAKKEVSTRRSNEVFDLKNQYESLGQELIRHKSVSDSVKDVEIERTETIRNLEDASSSLSNDIIRYMAAELQLVEQSRIAKGSELEIVRSRLDYVREEIKHLGTKKKLTDKLLEREKDLTDELKERARIQAIIDKMQFRQDFLGKTKEYGMSTGSYESGSGFEKALEISSKQLDARERQARMELEEKEGNKAITYAEYLDQKFEMEKYFARERVLLEARTQEEMLEATRARLEEESMTMTMNMDSLSGIWEGIKHAHSMAVSSLISENINLVENISGLMSNMYSSTLNMFSSLTEALFDNSEENSKRYKKILASFFKDVGKMLMEFALKLMLVIMLQKIAGVLGAAGGTASESAMNTEALGTGDLLSDFGSKDLLAPGANVFGMTAAEGGMVVGGVPNKDSVPALLMPNEYIIPADAVKFFGSDFMEMIKNKEIRRMQSGGLVKPKPESVATYTKKSSPQLVSDDQLSSDSNNDVYYVNIQTNDVNSFRQYLYSEKNLISNMVLEDFMRKRILRK